MRPVLDNTINTVKIANTVVAITVILYFMGNAIADAF